MNRFTSDLLAAMLFVLVSGWALALGRVLAGAAGAALGLGLGSLLALHLSKELLRLFPAQKRPAKNTWTQQSCFLFSAAVSTSASSGAGADKVAGIAGTDDRSPPGTDYLDQIYHRLKHVNGDLWQQLRRGVLASCHARLYTVQRQVGGVVLDWRGVNRLTVAAFRRYQEAASRKDRLQALEEIMASLGHKLAIVREVSTRKTDHHSSAEQQFVLEREAELWRLAGEIRQELGAGGV